MTAPYLALAVPGTGESWPGDARIAVTGMLLNITGKLDPELFDSRWVAYDASYGFVPLPNGVSYAESVQKGLGALLAILQADLRPVVLTGYSQGAAVVSALLDLIAAGHYPELKGRIIGAVLLANPARPDTQTETLGPKQVPGYGITYNPLEPAPARVVRAVEVANPDDAICSAAPDSLLRGLGKVTEFMSFVDLQTWGTALYFEALEIDWRANAKNMFGIAYQLTRFNRSVGEAFGYLTGRHTAYNVEWVPGTSTTYTDMSVRWVQAAAADFTAKNEVAA
jgi:pimeloyl-ACP methyl ester carboxylesterase